ncbi:MAG: sulfurtransferase [Rhodothermales bacterium]|nr:sulfurtransferase [Rhodothermales bacterium]
MSSSPSLVTTAWVLEHLEDPDLRIVEVDENTDAFGSGHIPGAVAWNWQTQLQHQTRRDIVGKHDLELLLGKSGITRSTTVVLYGDNQNWFAAYAFWLLRYYGHDSIRLMDGGRQKWKTEGKPWTKQQTEVPLEIYRITRENVHLRALQLDVFRHLDNPTGMLVDVRTPDEFAGLVLAPPGLNETAQRGGHIPGASNIPWSEVLNEDGTFKSLVEISRLYESRGIHAQDEIITYCRIGERSSHSWFVLKELLGYESVRNYDGSWTEWGNLIGAPIDVGGHPERTPRVSSRHADQIVID